MCCIAIGSEPVNQRADGQISGQLRGRCGGLLPWQRTTDRARSPSCSASASTPCAAGATRVGWRPPAAPAATARSSAPTWPATSASRPSAYEPDSLPAQSARNRFTGIVTRVERDKLIAIVEIQAGPHRLVSLMTREAADELDLQPGDLAVAAVKSTNVVVEVPRA